MYLFIHKLFGLINRYYYKFWKIPRYYDMVSNQYSYIHIMNILGTMKKLLHSDRSLSRFGDGEISWMLKCHSKYGFENNSNLLSHDLLKVFNTNNNRLMITLPDGFHLNKYFVSRSAFFWKQYCIKYYNKILPLIDYGKQYYNTSVTRPYIDFNTNKIAIKIFNLWKKFWDNKNVLVVEGSESRLGVGDDLFNNIHNIKRIECPPKNAFEQYGNILHKTLNFLSNHDNYITFISLGPTATILAYDLCNYGFRAIDIGHIDIEYDWYLMGAKEKIDLPYKYVNEVSSGRYALPINNSKYNNEIVGKIK